MRKQTSWFLAVFITLFACLPIIVGAASSEAVSAVPISGKKVAGVKAIDEVMLKYMKEIGCSAATVAVAKKGKIKISRGYGWLNENNKTPTPPDAIIGIASCEKPVTKAAITYFFKSKRMDLDTPLLEVINVKPATADIDPRIKKITIRHLLDHKAGWGADPLSRIDAKAKEEKSDIPRELSLVLAQPLLNDPGSKEEYCNFGFDLLRYILAEKTRTPAIDYFTDTLPHMDKGFYGNDCSKPKPGKLVWNADEGGPVAASAPALLSFMKSYWLNGKERKKGNGLWVMYGSLPGSTAMMIWRSDGVDIAALFNGRGAPSHDQIMAELEKAIDDALK